MLRMLTGFSCSLLLVTVSSLQAASLYRCVDAQGQVSFTQQGCPNDQNSYEQTMPTNAAPGATTSPPQAPHPQMKRSTSKSRASSSRSSDALVVIGQSDDGCGNHFTDRERRLAILQKHIRPHMTRQNVESALGRPDSIQSHNGTLHYHYQKGKRTTSLVTFDENGCVK